MGDDIQLGVTVRDVRHVVLLHCQIGELGNDDLECQEATTSAQHAKSVGVWAYD